MLPNCSGLTRAYPDYATELLGHYTGISRLDRQNNECEGIEVPNVETVLLPLFATQMFARWNTILNAKRTQAAFAVWRSLLSDQSEVNVYSLADLAAIQPWYELRLLSLPRCLSLFALDEIALAVFQGIGEHLLTSERGQLLSQ